MDTQLQELLASITGNLDALKQEDPAAYLAFLTELKVEVEKLDALIAEAATD